MVTQDAFDLFTWPGDNPVSEERLIVGIDPAGPDGDFSVFVMSLEVELPHPDARLLTIRPFHDGTWYVSLVDSKGVGHDCVATGHGPDTLSASRDAHPRLLESIAARVKLDEARDAARAARAALTGPEPYPSGRGVTTAVGPRRGRPPESQTVTGPYNGSVPRNALVWDVSPDGVRVQLKSGLVWADVGGSEERVFRTVRLAKDHTRGAISA